MFDELERKRISQRLAAVMVRVSKKVQEKLLKLFKKANHELFDRTQKALKKAQQSKKKKGKRNYDWSNYSILLIIVDIRLIWLILAQRKKINTSYIKYSIR